MEELDKKVSEIVRLIVKELMESLPLRQILAFLEENKGTRNGHYKRDIGTKHRKIDVLSVLRDRDNEFQIALFERYQRNFGIDGLVMSVYS